MLPLCMHHGQHGSGRPCALYTSDPVSAAETRHPCPVLCIGVQWLLPRHTPPTLPPPMPAHPPPTHPPSPPDGKVENDACVTRRRLGLCIYADSCHAGCDAIAALGLAYVPRCPGIHASQFPTCATSQKVMFTRYRTSFLHLLIGGPPAPACRWIRGSWCGRPTAGCWTPTCFSCQGQAMA